MDAKQFIDDVLTEIYWPGHKCPKCGKPMRSGPGLTMCFRCKEKEKKQGQKAPTENKIK